MVDLSICKEFVWDMAHMLAGHEGLCANVHGHTYKMLVEVSLKNNSVLSGSNSSEEGMIMDFSRVKEIVNAAIVQQMDHAFIYWKNSTDLLEHEIAALLKKHGRKVVEVSFKSTVEEMAMRFFEILNAEFEKHNIVVKKISVWETPTSSAVVTND